MNKQEALEALLELVRKWETSEGRMSVPPARVLREMGSAMEELEEAEGYDPEEWAVYLILVGAGALYLLVGDDVDPVVGRSLEAWLTERRAS